MPLHIRKNIKETLILLLQLPIIIIIIIYLGGNQTTIDLNSKFDHFIGYVQRLVLR